MNCISHNVSEALLVIGLSVQSPHGQVPPLNLLLPQSVVAVFRSTSQGCPILWCCRCRWAALTTSKLLIIKTVRVTCSLDLINYSRKAVVSFSVRFCSLRFFFTSSKVTVGINFTAYIETDRLLI